MHSGASLHVVAGQGDLRSGCAVSTRSLQRPDISAGASEQLLYIPGSWYGDLRYASEASHGRDVYRGWAGGGGSGATRVAQAGPSLSVTVEYSPGRNPDRRARGETHLRLRAGSGSSSH